jgi:peptide/nickel transport system permease protein
MAAYILRRLLGSALLLLVILTLVFVVVHLAPGDPTALVISPTLSLEAAAQLRRSYGLDDSIAVQYLRWLGLVARGEFGYSLHSPEPIGPQILRLAWNSLQLTATSLVLIYLAATVGSLALDAVPAFWIAIVLMLLLAHRIEWFPISGMDSFGAEYWSAGARLRDRLWHMALPVATMVLAGVPGLMRYVRGAMLEVTRQDYVLAARARGLSERRVLFTHALRNAMIPVVTLFGLDLPYLLSGSVLVETVFAWPGLGGAVHEAVLTRDYPMVMATTLVMGGVVIAGNLLADLLYAAADPRVRR